MAYTLGNDEVEKYLDASAIVFPSPDTRSHLLPQVDRTSSGILSIHAMLRQVQLRWRGHLVTMDGERLPKRLFYGDVTTGARRHGGPKRRYNDTLKKSLEQL
ncbi:unnamed protein product [Schistocephalus solidus]|uniref:Transposase n=1 Tax=Schistocephalus solidus TaxID=70667 RepID=A0A183SHC4_SCHSO|nr:unnamed protein product [Schistocephalus solidus]